MSLVQSTSKIRHKGVCQSVTCYEILLWTCLDNTTIKCHMIPKREQCYLWSGMADKHDQCHCNIHGRIFLIECLQWSSRPLILPVPLVHERINDFLKLHNEKEKPTEIPSSFVNDKCIHLYPWKKLLLDIKQFVVTNFR